VAGVTSDVAVVDQWYAAIRSGDATALRRITGRSVYVAWNGDPSVIPWAGRYDGVDAVLAFFAQVSAHLEVLSIDVAEQVVAQSAITIVLDGHWRVRKNGREVRARAANIFRIEDGLIVGYEVYPDSGRFAAAVTET
jgi:ketosteroid isomerase-like protein